MISVKPILRSLPAVLTILTVITTAVRCQTGENYADHPCYRPCLSGSGNRKICRYNFTLSNSLILAPRLCGSCPLIRADCNRRGCITSDGSPRGVSVVNGVFPGPAIRVCEGDRVVVNVRNNLLREEATIHWHGIHQKKTNFMDGVPLLTQCGIPVGGNFKYEFDTPVGGTYFWHSHEGVQRADGMAGFLVVRKPAETNVHNKLYDFDLAEHEMLIQDWLPKPSLPSLFKRPMIRNDSILASNLLVNGRGFPAGYFSSFRAQDTIQSRLKPFMSLHEVRIRQKKSYRFRVTSNGVADCPIEMSIEKHSMKIIATDGFDVEPVTVKSLVIFAGERFDFVLTGDQPIGSYWIKYRGLLDCSTTKAFQLAVLNYEGIPSNNLPSHSIKSWEKAAPESGLQINPLNIAPGDQGQKYMTVAELKQAALPKNTQNGADNNNDDDPEIISQEKADHQFYLAYDADSFENARQHLSPYINVVPQLNFISLEMPTSPPVVYPDEINSIKKCNDEINNKTKTDCTKKSCKCTHWLKVGTKSIVEFVLFDRGFFQGDSSHPFHLHGHSFRVVAMQKLNETTELDTIKERDANGLIQRVRSNAPIKDTVQVPNGGYTILRFRANNPGLWLFHCHIEFHAIMGMGLILQVGEPDEMPQLPADFPKCEKHK